MEGGAFWGPKQLKTQLFFIGEIFSETILFGPGTGISISNIEANNFRTER
jgi:hypothetical protein